jgi:hypothetical protein
MGEDKFYGWPVLSLEKLIVAPADYIESRSVYANLYDTSQQIAILRAVSWNGEAVRKLIREHGREFKLIIPARFVKLPIEALKGWLLEFDRTRVTVNIACPNETTNVKKIRIEPDYTCCIFEKMWQTHPVKHSKLDQRWDRVWRQMTQILLKEPWVQDLDEDFWYMSPEVRYDFRVYQPDWFDFS